LTGRGRKIESRFTFRNGNGGPLPRHGKHPCSPCSRTALAQDGDSVQRGCLGGGSAGLRRKSCCSCAEVRGLKEEVGSAPRSI
jgi:hypothetical protein